MTTIHVRPGEGRHYPMIDTGTGSTPTQSPSKGPSMMRSREWCSYGPSTASWRMPRSLSALGGC
jgi:hypothetical protein